MRISSGDNCCQTRTAKTARHISSWKQTAFSCEAIEVRGSHMLMSHKTVVGPVMIVRDNKEDVCLFCCDEFRLKRHQRRRNNLHTMPKNRRAACSSQKTAPTFQILAHDDCFRRFSEKRTILSSVRLACRGMKTTIYYEIQRHSRGGLLWFVYRRPWSLLDFFPIHLFSLESFL